MRRSLAFLVLILYQTERGSVKYILYEKYENKQNIPEDGIPTTTTSLKNVGLDEPERSGTEYVSVGSVNLSPHKLPIVNTADSTVNK